jgi:hypothetical protein
MMVKLGDLADKSGLSPGTAPSFGSLGAKPSGIASVISSGFGSGLAGAGLNLAGGLFGAGISAIAARKQRKFAREMQDRQFNFAREMWNKNNEYNTPLAARGRLEEAGYNPQMLGAEGLTSAQSNSGVPQGSSGSSSYTPATSGLVGTLSSLGTQFSQSRNLDTQNITALAEAYREASRIDNQNARNNMMSTIEQSQLMLNWNTYDTAATETAAHIGLMAEQSALLKLQGLGIKSDIATSVAKTISEVMTNHAYTHFLDKQGKYFDVNTEATRLANYVSRYYANMAKAKDQAFAFTMKNGTQKFKDLVWKVAMEEFSHQMKQAPYQAFGQLGLGVGATLGGVGSMLNVFKGKEKPDVRPDKHTLIFDKHGKKSGEKYEWHGD